MKKIVNFFILVFLFVCSVEAQTKKDVADKLFSNRQYSSAQSVYQEIINQGDQDDLVSYYHARCAKELFNSDALFLYNKFIQDYPYSNLLGKAHEDIALIYFHQKDYSQTVKILQNIDLSDLNSSLKFKLAYSNFKIDSLQEASYLFSILIKQKNKYSEPSKYYYAYIFYTYKNYTTALTYFLDLLGSEKFGSIVPYYVAQIYFSQREYNKVISFVSPLINNIIPSRFAEMNRLLAEAYFYTEEYKNAIIYFEKYCESTQEIIDPDYYLLGYSYYMVNDYQNCIKQFEKISSKSDSIIQYSAYYLGSSYLKLDNQKYAIQAFKKAASIDYNWRLKEDAYFNYAKLSYELILPFDNTLNILNAYSEIFNKTLYYKKEIETLFVQVLQGSSKYYDAYTALKEIVSPNKDQKFAMQNISYFLGVQAYNAKEYKKAVDYFISSNLYPINTDLYYMSSYWMADAYYQQEDFLNAISIHGKIEFMQTKNMQYHSALQKYNFAYCYFQKGNYVLANKYFRIYESLATDSVYLHDSYLRIADGCFMSNDYSLAEKYYEKAIEYNLFDIDYAIYNRSIALGLLQENDEKVSLLKKLVKEYSSSVYYDDAIYNLASYYKDIANQKEALKYYDQVILCSGEHNLLAGSRLGKGVLYLNNNEYENALEQFIYVTDNYSNTQYFREAMAGIEQAYTAIGKIEDYLTFIKEVPNFSLSKSEQDSLIYNTGFIQFSERNYISSNDIFKKYINDFPQGIFLSDALYYSAISSLELEDTASAVLYYNLILEKKDVKHQEKALVFLARKYYNSDNFVLSNKYYSELQNIISNNSLKRETIIRLMYGNENLDVSLASQYAEDVLRLEKTDDWLLSKANTIIARNAFTNGNFTKSNNLYKQVAAFSKHNDGAEAMYYIAYFTFLDDSLLQAEKLIFELAESYHNDHYIAKGFLLLADIYIKQENNFQAKATLESIINNHDGEELVNLAKDKIDKILKEESDKLIKEDIQSYIDVFDDEFNYTFDVDTTLYIDFGYKVIDTLNIVQDSININIDE